jgi:uncharacterized protein
MTPVKISAIRLVLFTRYPVPGAAKTRLIPALGADGAAVVHKTLTERTVATLRQAGQPIEICYTGGKAQDFTEWLGGDLRYVPQVEGDLTDRLLAALYPAPVIFFGSDTPNLSPAHVEAAIAALEHNDVAIGPADDGGYYLIALAKPYPDLFRDIRWSSEHTMADTLARAEEGGLSVTILETLHDCDRPEDLTRWPWLTA